MVQASSLRWVTSSKNFQRATPLEDALAFVDALWASPGVHLAAMGPESSKMRQLCLDGRLGGNVLPAAAAHLVEHLVAWAAIEPLDESVLVRLAGPDGRRLDIVLLGPVDERV